MLKTTMVLYFLFCFKLVFLNGQISPDDRILETDLDSVQVIYLDNYYAMYQSLSEAKWSVYINLIADNRLAPGELGGLIPFNTFGFEHLVGNRSSFYGELQLGDTYFRNKKLTPLTTLSLNGRYFFKTSRDRLLQRSRSNLTGPFASAGYLYQLRDDKADGQGFRLAAGWQNRIFQYGYYIVSLELTGIYGLTNIRYEPTLDEAVGTNLIESYGWIFRLLPRINMGVSLGERPFALPNCAILSCQRERDYLLKWNFLTLMPILGQLQSTSIEFENKLRNSPISILTGVSFRFLNEQLFNFSDGSSVISSRASAFRLFLEPRYYWNLKKRDLKGEAGSGFSANFIGLEVLIERGVFSNSVDDNLIQRSDSGFTSFFLNHGWQREFGKNFWVQARLGLAFTKGEVLWIEQKKIVDSNLFRPAGDIKCGFYL